MDDAARQAGRDPAGVKLVAVSKNFPAQAVCDAIDAGHLVFGENRVEEALPKADAVSAFRPASPVAWHLIGHLQSRKARVAGRRFALIHSVDSVRLAAKIAAQGLGADPAPQPILLQCNVSGEQSKEGFALSGWERDPALLDAFMREVAAISALPGVSLRGLMTIAPIVSDPALARPVFASLRALRDALCARFPAQSWDVLSMGMSDDFEAAIAEGATLIRIGRAIFGGR